MNKTVKLTPKLQELCLWDKIDKVNAMLDDGESPGSVHTWIVRNGFRISHPLVYEYANIRKDAIAKGLTMDHLLGTVPNRDIVDKKDEMTRVRISNLRSEIDALDLVIQKGYENLVHMDAPIPVNLMMTAIKLKSELTGGYNGYLTNYGLEQLRDVEQKKYEVIIAHLLSFIPENKREQAAKSLETVEEEYYKGTEFYDEYLRAKGREQ